MQVEKKHIALIKRQDRKAQFELYRMCYGYMMSISLRYQSDKASAEDVTNRAFLKVVNAIDSYNPKLDFKPWLARITVNENIDAVRKNTRMRNVIEFDSDKVTADHNLNHYEYNEAAENLEADQLRTMINQLPDTTGKVFNLYVIDGYKHYEIGEKLDITTGTSKWHLNNARKRLKAMIIEMKKKENIIRYGE